MELGRLVRLGRLSRLVRRICEERCSGRGCLHISLCWPLVEGRFVMKDGTSADFSRLVRKICRMQLGWQRLLTHWVVLAAC